MLIVWKNWECPRGCMEGVSLRFVKQCPHCGHDTIDMLIRKAAKADGRADTIRRLLEANEDLRCKVDALEAAVRGEQGIVFED